MSCVVSEIICLKCTQVCNKCGLFERTHAVPRPKTLPRRHRLRPTVCPNMGHPFDHASYCHHDDHPSVQPFASHIPDAFGSTSGETSSQGMSWVNHGVLPTPSRLSPSHAISPQPSSTYHTRFQLSSTVPAPAEAACLPSHLGISRHSPNVVENRCFGSCE